MHRKLGGLPVYVWGAVLVGGLLLGIYLRRRASSSSGGAIPTNAGVASPASFGDLTTGAATDPSVAAGNQGMDPALSDTLLGFASSLVASEQTLGSLADSSTQGALSLAGDALQQSFGLAQSVIPPGGMPYTLLPPLYSVPSSSYGSSPVYATPTVAPSSSPPAAFKVAGTPPGGGTRLVAHEFGVRPVVAPTAKPAKKTQGPLPAGLRP